MNIQVTDSAKAYLAKAGKPNVSLNVKGGGCSGFQYVWDLTDEPLSDPIDDVLVVDPIAEMYILGSVVDYVEELGGSFLSVKNPASTSSCGCGESFGI